MAIGNGEGSPTPETSVEECVEATLSPLPSVRPTEDLCPVAEETMCPADFLKRMREQNTSRGSPAWDVLWSEYKSEHYVNPTGVVYDDDDGAVLCDGFECRLVNVPVECAIPSRELMRQHLASGHIPYRPWCKHCVSCAANMDRYLPGGEPVGNIPEVHADYSFFRDRKGDTTNTATVLMLKEMKKKVFAAHVVPKKGSGDGS